MFKHQMSENRIIAGIGVFFLIGIVLHMVPVLSFIPKHITDLFLFSVNLLVLVGVLRMNRRGTFLLLSLLLVLTAMVFTFLAEAVGVHTGRVFGSYHYGSAMKLQLLEVPLIIPFNWVMLVLGMTSLIRSMGLPTWIVPVLAAFGLVLFDYTMEPVAVALDYWTWQDGVIPLQNYLAWFVIALLVSGATVLSRINLDKKILRYYVFIQWLFFLVLNVFYRWFGA